MPTITTYNYSKTTDFVVNNTVAPAKFVTEINASSIIIALGANEVTETGDNVAVEFKDALSAGDKTTLDNLVATHDGVEDNVDPIATTKIYEHDTQVEGSYSSETLVFSVPSGTGPHTKAFSYSFPIAILDLHFVAKAIHDGDEITVCVADDYFLGPIAADITASDSTVDVPSAMAPYMKPGKKLVIDDSTNSEVFDIISFDAVNNRVTIDGSYVNGYTASTPTNVAVGNPLVRYMKLDSADAMQSLGEGKVGGTTVPANININIKYTNNEGSAKEFKATIEFLY